MADNKDLPNWVKLVTLKPNEAYDFFTSKRLTTSFRWTDVWAEEHNTAFTVAGMLKEDLLKTVQEKLAEAIANGTSLHDFEKALTPKLIESGWWGKQEITDPSTGETRVADLGSPTRLKLIYEMNVRSAYAAGRWQQAQATKEAFPFMLMLTMRDERVRADHRELEGLVVPIDHPFLNVYYTPLGWRCRCMWVPVDEDLITEYAAAGIKIKRDIPKITMQTYVKNGKKIKVPKGVDPGFGYNVGKSRSAGVKR